MYALGFILALLIRIAAGEEWTEVNVFLPFYKLAGILAFVLARMPLRVEGSFDFFVQVSGSMSGLFSVLFGFAIVALALVMAGRYVVQSRGITDVRTAMLEGGKVGIPFAGIVLIASSIFSLTGDTFTIGPDPAGSVWRALVYGGVFGALGGLRAVRKRLPAGWANSLPERYRLWGHGVSGAFTGVIYGLIAALVVLIIAAVVVYFAVDEVNTAPGGDQIGALVAYLIGLPNLLIVTLLLAHGGTFLVAGETLGLPQAGIRINYFNVPGPSEAGSIDPTFTTAPWYAFLLLLIPVLAVWIAGYSAAARARITTLEEAKQLSWRVGIPYGLILWALGALATSSFSGEGFVDVESIRGSASFGVSLLGAFFLPLLWGTAGTWFAASRYVHAQYPARIATDKGAHRATQPTAAVRPVPAPANPAAPGERRICGKCGTANSPEHRFCRSCGNDISAQE